MNSVNPLYVPYGAYELKAVYQRNMLIGLLITTTFVVTAVLTGWFLSRVSEPTPFISPGPTGPPTEIKTKPQKSIIVERAPLNPSFAQVIISGIPDPVPDEEIGDLDAIIPTTGERAAIIDDRFPFDDNDEGVILGTLDDQTDYIPQPDEITFVEIYPELIHQSKPEYPRFARNAGLEGIVHIKALVMTDGSVGDAMVQYSSGVPSLDEAALGAAKKNVFKPGVQNGHPVACWVVYQVQFELSH